MVVRMQCDERQATRVALCYLCAAIAHLESEQGFSLPKSRRLSSRWLRWLRAADHRASAAAIASSHPLGDLSADARIEAGDLSAPSAADVTIAATDLLVSAFRESCGKAVLKDGSRDAALDCVVVLALERAHETCAAVVVFEQKGEQHEAERRAS
ncbi:MAG: hypothetical protein H0W40_04545 [Methylibium sp.]|uniref:hypothetical protein n=1 Tax=Methylibium sp. TaxID=2067992 RepID=UPI00181E4586|nr:hypothetical protein [Methylibium sp.]MBA3596632.1 hypothetical protein [Methylibium sp.]